MEITKEKAIDNIKKALQHKEEALKRTEEQWKKEGIEGKVVFV